MMSLKLFPEIEPYSVEELQGSDLHSVVYEQVGNPKGRPALFLHGGPGVGILPPYRRFFDPEFYRIVLLDQRGAGRSKPHAELRENTTWHLVQDLEVLRNRLDIDDWIVMGGSWGSTLALSYAITHPDSVAGLIIRGVFLARPSEHAWLHQEGGASCIFPDEWEKHMAPLAREQRDDTVRAYHDLLTGDDGDARLEAARAWTRWQVATMTLIPDQKTIEEMTRDHSALANGRIECHYTLNKFFMPSDDYILENAAKIHHVPCRIVQGRYDVICPMISAWELHKALPKSELRIVPDGSHSPMDSGMIHELIQGSEDFKEY